MNGVLAVFVDGKEGSDEMKKLKKMTDGATAPTVTELAEAFPSKWNAIPLGKCVYKGPPCRLDASACLSCKSLEIQPEDVSRTLGMSTFLKMATPDSRIVGTVH